jgi:hypothetical protein
VQGGWWISAPKRPPHVSASPESAELSAELLDVGLEAEGRGATVTDHIGQALVLHRDLREPVTQRSLRIGLASRFPDSIPARAPGSGPSPDRSGPGRASLLLPLLRIPPGLEFVGHAHPPNLGQPEPGHRHGRGPELLPQRSRNLGEGPFPRIALSYAEMGGLGLSASRHRVSVKARSTFGANRGGASRPVTDVLLPRVELFARPYP